MIENKSINKSVQSNFDIACDVFYESVREDGIEFGNEEEHSIITSALLKFRDELRDQMGNDKFVVQYNIRGVKE